MEEGLNEIERRQYGEAIAAERYEIIEIMNTVNQMGFTTQNINGTNTHEITKFLTKNDFPYAKDIEEECFEKGANSEAYIPDETPDADYVYDFQEAKVEIGLIKLEEYLKGDENGK